MSPHTMSCAQRSGRHSGAGRPELAPHPAPRRSTSLAALLLLATACYITLLLQSTTHHSQALASAVQQQQQHLHQHQQQQFGAPNQSARNSSSLNYLLYSSSNQKQQPQLGESNVRDDEIARLLKDKNHSHAADTVDLALANTIWRRMHQNALRFARDSAHAARPTINGLLDEARVSSACKQSLNDALDHLANLDDWAVEMYNSMGDFPATGFFEGSYTSMGSYHQCVNVPHNQWIGAAQYCTLKFQPVVPKRPRYHNILATIDNLANFTSTSDMFHGLAKKAQYFYYTKLRLATCMPSKCATADLDLIGEQIALNTYLQYQGVQCLQKAESFDPDGTQVFALVVLIALASVSVVGTLVHLINLRSLIEVKPSSPLCSVPVDLTTGSKGKKNGLHLDMVVVGVDGQFANNNIKGNNNNVKVGSNNNLDSHHELHLNHLDQKGVPLLAAGGIQSSSPSASIDSGVSIGAKSKLRLKSTTNARLLRALEILMHFSILRNGRKLFDTSTSRRGNGRAVAGSLVPNMQVDSSASSVIGCSTSSTSGSRTDASSVDGHSNDISCVHGLRFWTISWIILGHTMQYTEWAGFGRAYQVEQNITSFFLHPFLNATFSVDTFFLISGLLTTYVTWTITRGQYWRFNKFAFLISRYLRLMPQVLLVILIFIIYPLFGDGPFWKGVVEKESANCKKNWWVSALFLQAFYRQDQICNLVTWWLSIEMFYHFISIFVIIGLLHSARRGLAAALLVGGSLTAISCYLHFVNHYPPNMLPTLLQRYEIWDSIVLKYFWTPYPHAPSYFVGLLLGYALYNRSINQLSRRQVRYGWTAFAVCYLTILYGTYHWNKNAPYSRLVSTTYYNLSQVLWSLATGWAILACALGHGGWLNTFLSSPCFIPLGRATYMTYLSHMLIVMSYPAKMNLLIEPSYVVFLYIFISNLVLSYALGIFLTLVYESPILHLQKLLVSQMAHKFNEADMKPSRKNTENKADADKTVRVSLYTQPQQLEQQQLQPQAQRQNQVPI